MQVRAALPVSATAHAAIIGLLLLLPGVMPAPPKIDLSNAVEVVFAPSPTPPVNARPPVPPVAEQPPPPPLVEQPPPPPPAPQVAQADPPPPPKPAPKPRPKPVPPIDRPPQNMAFPLPTAPAPAAAPQVASLPPAVQPVISADYRATLSSWLESHKRYPDDARQRGEEGRAVLRFRVERSGRVLNYAVVSSTGYPDLDAAIDAMMRGATLPPFPADMTASDVEVSVTVRFALTH